MNAIEEKSLSIKLVKAKRSRGGFVEVKDIDQIECNFNVQPSKKPHSLRLFTRDGEQLKGTLLAGNGLKVIGQAEEVIQLYGQFTNESQMIIPLKELPATTFNFSKHFELQHATMDLLRQRFNITGEYFQKNMFLLPPVAMPSSVFDKTKGEIQVHCGKKLVIPLEFKVSAGMIFYQI